jgi:nucleoside phosphorylase
MCGLGGALAPTLHPGSVVVPDEVSLPGGATMSTDQEWNARLTHAAVALGFTVTHGPLLTAPALVTGHARAEWARAGYSAVDMETGLLIAHGWEVSVVRVILDTPLHSISREWERPADALQNPRLWREMAWLAQSAPRYAFRAARIVRRALYEH